MMDKSNASEMEYYNWCINKVRKEG